MLKLLFVEELEHRVHLLSHVILTRTITSENIFHNYAGYRVMYCLIHVKLLLPVDGAHFTS